PKRFDSKKYAIYNYIAGLQILLMYYSLNSHSKSNARLLLIQFASSGNPPLHLFSYL
ncbi:hypothetical protein L9F63_006831, partial [Diploptera punctata]